MRPKFSPRREYLLGHPLVRSPSASRGRSSRLRNCFVHLALADLNNDRLHLIENVTGQVALNEVLVAES
jgi:hypothetical protein